MKARASLLIVLCLILLAWNMALSTRRRYFSGKMVTVKQEDVVLKVSCPGKIEPKVQQTIRSLLDGNKKSVLVKEGDVVKQGQLLMEISDEKIRMELNQKNSAFRNATSDYTKAQKDYQLEQSLFKQGAVPRRDVENAKQTYERAGQALVASQEDLGITQKKQKG
jgi:multidrug efflux pump subunit AcrA (membrane-fusion protein)